MFCLAMVLLAAPLATQELRDYFVSSDQAEFDYIIANPFEDNYIDCAFEYNDSIWTDTRIRIRGESSREYPQKSFKINFDADNRFFGRDKINLAAEWTDPSFCREYLSYDLFNRAGLPASQTWFVRLYVNDVYLGLYLDVEQVDEIFMARTGLPEDASIYKATGYGSLLTINEDVEALWEKKTHEETGNYDLYNLINWLENVPAESFEEELSGLFDLSHLSRLIAINALLANQSTYYHNYYLIHDLDKGGQWCVVPWDMDRTYIYWSNYSSPDYYRSGHQLQEGTNPLITKCWLNNSIRGMIFDNIQGLTDSQFTFDYYQSSINDLENLLYVAVAADTAKQFSTDDFVITLNALPAQAAGRSSKLLQKTTDAPLPFDLGSASVTPEGIFFNWNSSPAPESIPVHYTLQISPYNSFSNIVFELSGLEQTSLMISLLETGNYHWRIFAAFSAGGQTRSISYFNKFTVPSAYQNTIPKSGVLENSETWQSNSSVYSITGDLVAAANCTLSIEPGVEIFIGADKSISILGMLNAAGTETDSIFFFPQNPDADYSGFEIGENGSLNLEYTSISGGGGLPAGEQSGSYTIVNRGRLTAQSCRIYSTGQGAVYAQDAETTLEGTEFKDIPANTIYISGGVFSLTDGDFSQCSESDNAFDMVKVADISEDFYVSGCNFQGGADDIMVFNRVTGGTVEKNLILSAGDKGVFYASGSKDTYFANNIIYDCDEGFSILDRSFAII